MKTIVCVFFLSLMLSSASATTPRWTRVEIPVDSLTPTSLTFFDSLHGYLGAFIRSEYFGPPYQSVEKKHVWFETTNGGKTWAKLTDTVFASDSGFYLPFFYPSMLFPSLKDRFIFTGNYKNNDIRRIIHSSNYGASWQVERTWLFPQTTQGDFYFLNALSGYNLYAFNRKDYRIYQSSDGGKSFPIRYSDTVFRNTIFPFYPIDSSTAVSSISLAQSDPVHWTVTLYRAAGAKIQLGLQSLVSSNAGANWKTYNTPIPGEDDNHRLNGTLQCIKGTPTVFYFTGIFGEGLRDPAIPSSNYYVERLPSQPMYGINYLYSTDYGAHWEFHKEYGNSRRGFEAVGTKELWMTAANTDSLTEYDFAHKIIHTTDNGATWNVDSTTLTLETAKYDGRIVTFSDPGHGWIAAIDHEKHTFIYRYDASEQGNASVSESAMPYDDYCKLYPNPATDELSVQTLWFQKINKLLCYDMLGRQHDLTFQTSTNTAKASLKNLLPGCYFIQVIHSQGTYMRRFIVQ